MQTLTSFAEISIDSKSKTPKFEQVVNSIVTKIRNGNIKFGERIPSISELSEEFLLSRNTVEKAYTQLRKLGILESVPNKGYFVNQIEVKRKIKVFLFLHKLTDSRKLFYNSLISSFGDLASVSISVHQNNFTSFKKIIKNRLGMYDHYIILPPDEQDHQKLEEVLEQIPQEKLLILDKQVNSEKFLRCSTVFQDYQNDIYEFLHSSNNLIKKYNKIVLAFPNSHSHFVEVAQGLKSFCQETKMNYEIAEKVSDEHLVSGTLFIVLDEIDLIQVVIFSETSNLELGKKIGVISYNDSPIKEFLAKGITAISTDFEQMGVSTAKIILEGKNRIIKNPFSFKLRNSL